MTNAEYVILSNEKKSQILDRLKHAILCSESAGYGTIADIQDLLEKELKKFTRWSDEIIEFELED